MFDAQHSQKLAKLDPVLAKIIKKVGPISIQTRASQSPFLALLESIVYQQLTGKAAATIHGRVLELFPKKRPTPELVLKLSDSKLRGAGLSRAKTAAIQDLARHTLSGVVPPTTRALEKLDDSEIIERLTQVKGVGPWTVEMLLIFRLGRPNVLPTTDYGVRKGFALVYEQEMPHPKELAQFGQKWAPHRSIAAWYLWRALELPAATQSSINKTAPKASVKKTTKRAGRA